MKNRVNISKLIREKYGDNTISADEFNEIIDSVLQESDQHFYDSKIVKDGVSDSIPENQESENIFHRMYGQGEIGRAHV